MSGVDEARNEWFRQRVEQVHTKVTVYDVLGRNGVGISQLTDDQEEQISCPFHGADEKPSARVYPADARSHSHIWCFVCRERWDAIELWKKFNGGEEKKFGRVIAEIEQAFGLEVPDVPKGRAVRKATQEEQDLAEFDTLYVVCERRLKEARRAFDMTGYFKLGSALDRIATRVTNRNVAASDGTRVLQQVLSKIGEKVRACPDG